MDIMLPFKVGDTAESRSFSLGFRGAWFRSKICLMCIRQGHLECLLEYLDFTEEKKTWTRLYKVPPGSRKQKSSERRMIMVRPTFPQWYLEHEKPDGLPKTNVVAIVSSPWKVGDLVEWWYTDCYWTGKIVELIGDDKVKIALHKDPIGEGGYYDADCKDLRPALDWTLEKGWSVPLSQENGKSWYTAQLIIQSTDSGSSSSDEDIEQSCDGEEVQKSLNGASDEPAEAMGSGVKLSANVSDEIFINQGDGKEESLECLNRASNMPQEVTGLKGELLPNQNGHCCIKGETNSHIAKCGESPEAISNGQSSPISLKYRKTSSGNISVEVPPEIVDDTIMELEKVASKIRRLESLLTSPSKVAKPSWKFQEDASGKQHE
ncbi:unnamed protein product [Urochloa decumbens]|uniref:Agenet domain-containing protein n=1 Tax=Urochloa decumbens TaxID=240449 RepID=A0ABC8WXV4_9POAL